MPPESLGWSLTQTRRGARRVRDPWRRVGPPAPIATHRRAPEGNGSRRRPRVGRGRLRPLGRTSRRHHRTCALTASIPRTRSLASAATVSAEVTSSAGAATAGRAGWPCRRIPRRPRQAAAARCPATTPSGPARGRSASTSRSSSMGVGSVRRTVLVREVREPQLHVDGSTCQPLAPQPLGDLAREAGERTVDLGGRPHVGGEGALVGDRLHRRRCRAPSRTSSPVRVRTRPGP